VPWLTYKLVFCAIISVIGPTNATGREVITCGHMTYFTLSLASTVCRIGVRQSIKKYLMDVLYIRRSLAWIHAIVFGHMSEFQHIRVKTNLEAARMCIWSYTMHLIASI
jgi:hypothetical protein